MLYTIDELDRSTGQLRTKSLGEWITLSELARIYQVGPRRVRTILRELDFVYAPAATPKAAHRISPWAIEAGLGRHHKRGGRVRHAFDVISPAGQKWIAERWSSAADTIARRQRLASIQEAKSALSEFTANRGSGRMSAQEEVCWLADHFPKLSQDQMATVIDVTRQLVSRHLNVRARQIAERRRKKLEPLPIISRPIVIAGFESQDQRVVEVHNASPQHP